MRVQARFGGPAVSFLFAAPFFVSGCGSALPSREPHRAPPRDETSEVDPSATTPPACRELASDRSPIASDESEEARWLRPAEGVAIGPCENDADATCIRVDRTICDTDFWIDDEVEPSVVVTSGSEPVLVLRWMPDKGGNHYYAGIVVQVWTFRTTLRRVLSVLESWDEGSSLDEEGAEESEDEEWCHVARSVQVDERGITIGARETRANCAEVLSRYDRALDRTLDADARTWEWSELLRR